MGREGLLEVVYSSCCCLSSEEGTGKINFRISDVLWVFFFSLYKGQCFACFPSFPRTIVLNWVFPCMVFKCNCSCFRACWFAVQQGTIRFLQRCWDITKASSVLQAVVEQSRENQLLIARGRVTAAGTSQLMSSWWNPHHQWKADRNLQGGLGCPPTVGQLPPGPSSVGSPSTCPSWLPPSQGPWGLALELCRPGPPLLTWAKHKAMHGPVTHSLKTLAHLFREKCKQGKQLYKTTLENLDHH